MSLAGRRFGSAQEESRGPVHLRSVRRRERGMEEGGPKGPGHGGEDSEATEWMVPKQQNTPALEGKKL